MPSPLRLKTDRSGADLDLMARTKAERRPLTPEEAQKARRSIRIAFLAAVAHMWFVVVLIGLFYGRLLIVAVVIGVLYTVGAPVIWRNVNRDIDRRTIGKSTAQDAFGR
jgi:fatty acid desaturase